MKTIGYCALLLCFMAAMGHPSHAQNPLSDRALIETLRQGGYNIYFRHAATDWSQDDHVSAVGDWTSCDPGRMRQLSPAGRKTARRIGSAIKRLQIPIGRIFASEYCRARETAQHLDLGVVSSTRDIMNMRAAHLLGGREAVVNRAGQALSTPPRAGTNSVFVAHGNLMRAVSGAYTGEAGAVIFIPKGNGEFKLLAQLEPEDWERLAQKFARNQE